jgi:hypothetical protein
MQVRISCSRFSTVRQALEGRCRLVVSEVAGMGRAPQSLANADLERTGSGVVP